MTSSVASTTTTTAPRPARTWPRFLVAPAAALVAPYAAALARTRRIEVIISNGTRWPTPATPVVGGTVNTTTIAATRPIAAGTAITVRAVRPVRRTAHQIAATAPAASTV